MSAPVLWVRPVDWRDGMRALARFMTFVVLEAKVQTYGYDHTGDALDSDRRVALTIAIARGDIRLVWP